MALSSLSPQLRHHHGWDLDDSLAGRESDAALDKWKYGSHDMVGEKVGSLSLFICYLRDINVSIKRAEA